MQLLASLGVKVLAVFSYQNLDRHYLYSITQALSMQTMLLLSDITAGLQLATEKRVFEDWHRTPGTL